MDIENTCPQADGFGRDVFLRDPQKRDSRKTYRIRELGAPAFGLNDAPVARRRS